MIDFAKYCEDDPSLTVNSLSLLVQNCRNNSLSSVTLAELCDYRPPMSNTKRKQTARFIPREERLKRRTYHVTL